MHVSILLTIFLMVSTETASAQSAEQTIFTGIFRVEDLMRDYLKKSALTAVIASETREAHLKKEYLKFLEIKLEYFRADIDRLTIGAQISDSLADLHGLMAEIAEGHLATLEKVKRSSPEDQEKAVELQAPEFIRYRVLATLFDLWAEETHTKLNLETHKAERDQIRALALSPPSK